MGNVIFSACLMVHLGRTEVVLKVKGVILSVFLMVGACL